MGDEAHLAHRVLHRGQQPAGEGGPGGVPVKAGQLEQQVGGGEGPVVGGQVGVGAQVGLGQREAAAHPRPVQLHQQGGQQGQGVLQLVVLRGEAQEGGSVQDEVDGAGTDGLVLTDLEPLVPGGQTPVDALPAVPREIGAHRLHHGDVLEIAPVPRLPAPQLPQEGAGVHLHPPGVDHEDRGRVQGPAGGDLGQAEAVPGAQLGRLQAADAPPPGGPHRVPGHCLETHEEGQPPAVRRRAAGGRPEILLLAALQAAAGLHAAAQGQLLTQLQPGEGEQLVVDHPVAQGDLLPGKEGGAVPPDGYLHPLQGPQAPLPGTQAQQGEEEQQHRQQGVSEEVEHQRSGQRAPGHPPGGQQAGQPAHPPLGGGLHRRADGGLSPVHPASPAGRGAPAPSPAAWPAGFRRPRPPAGPRC